MRQGPPALEGCLRPLAPEPPRASAAHLASSVPLVCSASPSLLQDSVRLGARCGSQRLSQRSSSACDRCTRGFSGKTRTVVASVVTKQAQGSDRQSSGCCHLSAVPPATRPARQLHLGGAAAATSEHHGSLLLSSLRARAADKAHGQRMHGKVDASASPLPAGLHQGEPTNASSGRQKRPGFSCGGAGPGAPWAGPAALMFTVGTPCTGMGFLVGRVRASDTWK